MNLEDLNLSALVLGVGALRVAGVVGKVQVNVFQSVIGAQSNVGLESK